MREHAPGLLDAHPRHVVYLAGRRRGHRRTGAGARFVVVKLARGPVVDALAPSVRELVADGLQRLAERDTSTGFLGDLPHRAGAHRLPRLHLPLGERPVVVPGAVHQEHFEAAAALPPHERAGGAHHVLGTR